MNAKQKKALSLLFTREQARIIFLNADGWLDAGAGPEGLAQDEREALHRLCDLMCEYANEE